MLSNCKRKKWVKNVVNFYIKNCYCIAALLSAYKCTIVHSYATWTGDAGFYLNMNVPLIQQKVQTTFSLTLAIVFQAD